MTNTTRPPYIFAYAATDVERREPNTILTIAESGEFVFEADETEGVEDYINEFIIGMSRTRRVEREYKDTDRMFSVIFNEDVVRVVAIDGADDDVQRVRLDEAGEMVVEGEGPIMPFAGDKPGRYFVRMWAVRE